MPTTQTSTLPPGWVGGFAASNPAFSYPQPDLSSLPMLGNLDNIGLLQRQQAVQWPEFSWETEPGQPNPRRCFQMFAPDISRVGYTDTGRVYSIICPQQGTYIDTIGALNIEVTVTGQRGWVDETTRTVAADLSVEGKLWFSPSAHDNPLVKLFWAIARLRGLPFPSDKAHAIRVATHCPGQPDQPVFPGRTGESTRFTSPDFARHPEAWAVANLSVQIGAVHPTGNAEADEFNAIVMKLVNLSSGNLLQLGNILTWNVWFTPPSLVDQTEWRNHAEKWRKSIEADHGSPDGPGTAPRFFDGTPFNPVKEIVDEAIAELVAKMAR